LVKFVSDYKAKQNVSLLPSALSALMGVMLFEEAPIQKEIY